MPWKCLSRRRISLTSYRGEKIFFLVVSLVAWLLAITSAGAAAGEKEKAATARIRETVEFLADDQMQGRGLGTKGLDRAAGFIGQEFMRLGLKTDLCDGGTFQTFTVRVRSKNQRQQIDWLGVLRQIGVKADDKKQNADKDAKHNQNKGPEPPLHRDPGTLSNNSTAPLKNAEPRTAKIKNVVAALEGRGPRAEETIVIGAHYDHLGEQHTDDGETIVMNGANDNASGTTALLEVARILSSRKEKLPRRIVFVAFSGEELGLLGSLHYVDHPVVPLDKTIAMINLDMVGRLQDDSLITMGTGCSPMLSDTAERIAREHRLQLLPVRLSLPCSDHAPFHAHGVPVIFFATTAGWGDYHGPSDDAEWLNYNGIRRVSEMTADLAVTVAKTEKRPEFTSESFSGTLMRGMVRVLGRAAKEMATEPSDDSGQ
ncbi:MAG TPA: M20/M25/M40 family metallo-hydrolase [Thermoguttaceae bacterium]|nr:M20/M25/M40 family metallo-hydrolase [Thermoguttaceae bacterium]